MAAGNVSFVGSHTTNAWGEVYTFRSLSTRPDERKTTFPFWPTKGRSYSIINAVRLSRLKCLSDRLECAVAVLWKSLFGRWNDAEFGSKWQEAG